MAINLEVLHKAAEQYALSILQGTDQEKIQLIIEMLDRCSSVEVCDLLNKSQEDVTFDVRIVYSWCVKRLCVTKNGVCWYHDHPETIQRGQIFATISQRANAETLFRNGCNIRKLEKKFWADIQKIIDDAPK
jgi:hypothetical protein